MARYGSATTSAHLDVEVILLAWYLFFVFFFLLLCFSPVFVCIVRDHLVCFSVNKSFGLNIWM